MAAPPILTRISEALSRVPDSVRRVIPPLIFSAIFGVTALTLAHRWRAEQQRLLDQERARLLENYPEPIQVIVAAEDLPEGTTLESDHLKEADVPPLFVQPFAITRPDDVLGMVTRAPIAKEEQVLKNKLRRVEEKPRAESLSSVTPEGRRAVSIIVDTITGVAGFVRPGDQVDVLWVPANQEGQANPVTVTLFQDVPVLAVGGTMVGGATADAAGVPTGGENSTGQYTITVALGPQESSLLLFARQQGQLQLTLRPRAEHGELPIAPADMPLLMQKVMGGESLQPEVEEPRSREVEVYRGLERKVIILPGPGQRRPEERPVPAPPTTAPAAPSQLKPAAAKPPANPDDAPSSLDESAEGAADEAS
jgi:pilus assembly protein CpaB